MQAPIELTGLHLLSAGTLLLVTLGAVRLWGLGLEREFLVSTVRAVVQLMALGAVLGWVFERSGPGLVLAVVAMFVGVGAWTAVGRQQKRVPGMLSATVASLTVGGALLTLITIVLIVRVDPWWTPQYAIPLCGMIVANAMNAAALAVERLRAELSARRNEIEELLALGAGARQAVDASARAAFRAALRPTLNSLSVVGLVSIPGTMTGQILAGLEPTGAARYQLLVMLLWSAGTTGTCAMLLWRVHRSFFTPALQLRHDLLEEPP